MSLAASTSDATVPTPGQLVTVRQRRYVVTSVVGSALDRRLAAPATAGAQHLVQLQSIDDDGLGEELGVIWELEPGRSTFERTALPDPSKGYDDPARLDAFLDAVRWAAVASADVRAMHAPFRSGIAIEDYQLDPLVRAIEMPRVSLLIADDVGLGKTIEAGLVLQELLLRYRARTALVVCPAGLQLQWRDQMRDKFGLEFRIIDSEALRELRRARGLDVNPWTWFPRLITSIDYLKRDRPMRMMREALPGPGEPMYPRRFDLLIVDEAHNVAPSGRGSYATDTDRTACVRELAPHFEHKLFLTATPHNGYTESFAALLELLDDQRFHRGITEIDRVQLDRVMVRRLKKELPKDDLGNDRFPTRSLEALEVDFPEDERRAHALLREYSDLRAKAGDDDEGPSHATRFLMKLLKKRLFSSPEAFRLTLEAHVASIASGGEHKARPERVRAGILQREIQRFEEDSADDDDNEEETRAIVGATSRALRPLTKEERRIVDELAAWAEKASARLDAKTRAFFAWLGALVRPEKAWTDMRVIVFTEYRATQRWLAEKLGAHGFAEEGRILSLYGGMRPDEREKIKHAFQAGPRDTKARILLATDAASEGIDLQNHCSRLVHYEIPWNPNRLEQRNGRVDRHGQHEKRVEIFHFVGRGWHAKRASGPVEPGSLEADLEFLFIAAKKLDQIREDLGNAGDVIATQLEEAMLGKRRQLDVDTTKTRTAAARKALKFERDLEARLRRLMDQLHESRDELHIAPDAVKAVVDVGLAVADHPPLQRTTISRDGVSIEAWHVPELRGTWASCLDGLVHPHTFARRPITFDHEAARDRDDVVLAHLGHRLVQMCVGLLRAEVWAPEEQRRLSRVSARVATKLDKPVLAAYGRLVVLGGDNTRLHEDVLVAGAMLDRGRFVALSEKELTKRLDAASREAPRPVPVALQAELTARFTEHRRALEAALDERAKEREVATRAHLAERCNKEIADQTAILRELERALRAEFDFKKGTFDMFDRRGLEQYERNREAMKTRIAAIPAEIERETAAIRARYHAPTARLFPIAVTWWVPTSLVGR